MTSSAFILWVYCLHILLLSIHGGKLFIRSQLNETKYSKNRFVVTDFIDQHRMHLLNRLFKSKPSDVYDNLFGTYNKLNNINYFNIDRRHPELRQILTKDELCVDGKTNPTFSSCADFYLEVFKLSSVLAKVNISKYELWLEEIENYVYIRNKVFEYASEVFNTTVGPTDIHDGTTIYHFKARAGTSTIVNNIRYVFPPHCDSRSIGYNYDIPVTYLKGLGRNGILEYTKYTSLLFLNTIPDKDKGVLHFYDFPNHKTLPHAKSHFLKSSSDNITVIHSPLFADPDLKIYKVQAVAGTLVLFDGEDVVHGVTEYVGDVDRRSITWNLADATNYFRITNGLKPTRYEKKKEGPDLNYV